MKAKTSNNTNRTLESAMKEVQKEETVVIGFRIKKSMQKALKAKVLTNDSSIQEVLENFVEDYLNNKATKQQSNKTTI